MRSFFTKYKSACLATLAVIAFYALLFAAGITCPIKYITGISCPGCGMSRACFNALRLDFKTAFEYHPLWILLLPFSAILIALVIKKKRRALRVCVAIGIVLMLAVYVWRIPTCTNGVVVIEPQNGIFPRIFRKFFG